MIKLGNDLLQQNNFISNISNLFCFSYPVFLSNKQLKKNIKVLSDLNWVILLYNYERHDFKGLV